MTSQAMQQGGMGLILTTLILTAPLMAGMFFQGTLGSFIAYSQIGSAAGPVIRSRLNDVSRARLFRWWILEPASLAEQI
ncbi:MAG: hypothetical protein ACOH1V_00635 [Stenotrophomonas sp.]